MMTLWFLAGLAALGATGLGGQTSHVEREPAGQKVVRRGAEAITIDTGSPAAEVQFADAGKTLLAAASERWQKGSPGGSGGRLLRIDLLSRRTHNLITNLGDIAIGTVPISPGGRAVASRVGGPSGFSYRVQVWDVSTGKVLFATPEVDDSDWRKTGLMAISFSADGDQMLTLQRGGLAEVWGIRSKTRLHSLRLIQSGKIENATLSPSGRLIASVGEDGVLRLWDVKTGKDQELDDNVTCHHLAFSPDGGMLAVATNEGIDLWVVSTRKKSRQLTGQPGFVYSLAFNRDGSRLASGPIQAGQRRADWRGTVQVWDVKTGHPLDALGDLRGSIVSVAFSADGRQVAACSTEEPVIRMWRLAR